MTCVFDGGPNRLLGWTLLVAGFAGAMPLDPWSLSERNPAVLVGSPRMAVRHAQAVVVGMAFLQLMVAKLLTAGYFSNAARTWCSCLSGCGAVVYVAGYGLFVQWRGGAWLIGAGALLNFLAFALLAAASAGSRLPWTVRAILLTFCSGMLLDAVMGVIDANPAWSLSEYVGAEDGLRLRLLRLARAAVIALALLTLLYQDLARRAPNRSWLFPAGQIALVVGAVGMPLLLTVAGLTWTDIKYGLPITAQATFAGTLVGTWLASRVARPLELWGWLLVALSMGAGLLMGLYAFEGPLPAPEFLGEYNDFGRRLSRLAHAYCIVLGLLSIFVARDTSPERQRRASDASALGVPGRSGARGIAGVGVLLLVAGTVQTVAAVVFLETIALPLLVLSVGPALVTTGLLCCLAGGSVIDR
jgi:hypothetical protein